MSTLGWTVQYESGSAAELYNLEVRSCRLNATVMCGRGMALRGCDDCAEYL